jgi:hypothetical protein
MTFQLVILRAARSAELRFPFGHGESEHPGARSHCIDDLHGFPADRRAEETGQ